MNQRSAVVSVLLAAAMFAGACGGSDPVVEVSSAATCSELEIAGRLAMENTIEVVLGEVVGMDYEDFAQQADADIPGWAEYEEEGRQIELKSAELGCDPALQEQVVCAALSDVDAPDEALSGVILTGLQARCAADRAPVATQPAVDPAATTQPAAGPATSDASETP